MSVRQISVFTESKPGRLSRILGLFDKANVNVRGYSISDTGDYGIARFIVDKPELAANALKEAGAAFTEKEVLCLKLDDTPGSLASVMNVLSELGENVTYSYSMISTYIILCTNSLDETTSALNSRGIQTVDQSILESLEV
jgi:hypothetical protein